MPGTSRINSVTEDIEASYGRRIAAVADIVKETHQTLGNFHREHDKMAHELKRSLAASERERKKEFARLLREIQGDRAATEKDTAQTLAGFSADHRQAHNEWQKLTHVMAAKRAGKFAPAPKPKPGAPTLDKARAGKGA